MRPEPRPVPKKPARMAKPASTTGTLRSEAGAALVLVLVFMIVGGLIVGALTEAVTNGLKNTTNFATARSAQYDAFSATNLAIQSIRHLPLMSASQTLNASPPTSCVPTGVSEFHGSSDGNGNDVSVWCSTVWNAGAIDTRVVTLSACLSSVLPLACAASPMLQAVVTFDDYPPGISVVSLGQCVAYCGTSMTVNSWIRSPVVPSVTGISTATLPTLVATGDINGKALVTINGSGFVSAATVNFVEESNLVPTVDNVIIPATGVNVKFRRHFAHRSVSVRDGGDDVFCHSDDAGRHQRLRRRRRCLWVFGRAPNRHGHRHARREAPGRFDIGRFVRGDHWEWVRLRRKRRLRRHRGLHHPLGRHLRHRRFQYLHHSRVAARDRGRQLLRRRQDVSG